MIPVPHMSPEDLEKILDNLPEPSSAKLDLCGYFDYSSIYQQAEEVIQCMELENYSGLTVSLKNPEKEKILDIYRNSYIKNLEKPEDFEKQRQKRINLKEVHWYLDDVLIKLTPTELKIHYQGEEPDYIAQLRQELSKTTVRIEIIVNK